MADLPSSTQAPELDDANAEQALYKDERWTGEDLSEGGAVTTKLLGLYLAYLVAIGFIPSPPSQSGLRTLPGVEVAKDQQEALQNVGGRGTLT